ncbi:MAG TPA: hypothetical protein VE981_16955 [Planctomycetota bacterium]|nr:hypothetical protein [Planctomycetota bacterium]
MGKQAAVCVCVTVILKSASAWAQTGDPQLSTDHAYFPGEGAMSMPAKAVSHALAVPRGALGNSTNRDKLIRIFLWRGEHFAHPISPAVYNLPLVTPDPTGPGGAHPLVVPSPPTPTVLETEERPPPGRRPTKVTGLFVGLLIAC